MSASARPSLTAWPDAGKKARFAALAASRRLSQSKLLGLLVDSVLTHNPVDSVGEDPGRKAGREDHVSLRLRPGDGRLLRRAWREDFAGYLRELGVAANATPVQIEGAHARRHLPGTQARRVHVHAPQGGMGGKGTAARRTQS